MYFAAEFLFENCCEEFEAYVQHTILCSSNSQDGNEFNIEEVTTHESSSYSSFQEEDVWNDFDVNNDENMAVKNDIVDAFSNVFVVPNVF